jgi:hypothetical protein
MSEDQRPSDVTADVQTLSPRLSVPSNALLPLRSTRGPGTVTEDRRPCHVTLDVQTVSQSLSMPPDALFASGQLGVQVQ